MLRVVPAPDGSASVETLWTAPVLRTTYVVPVYHGGFLYGMNGRSTLTCVDAGDGRGALALARARGRVPDPGGDDLVVLTKEKSLHVGPASPEGWTERARLDLFHDLVWSSPAFADGAIFARSQGEIARVDWRPAAGRVRDHRIAVTADGVVAPPGGPAVRSRHGPGQGRGRGPFPRLPARRSAARVARPRRLPLPRDGERHRHRGGHDRRPPRGPDVARSRVPISSGTRRPCSPDARISYHFVRDFEERLPDPRNPWRVPGAADRDDRRLSRRAVVPRDAGMAGARPPRRGRAGPRGADSRRTTSKARGPARTSRSRSTFPRVRRRAIACRSPSSSTATPRARRASSRGASTT